MGALARLRRTGRGEGAGDVKGAFAQAAQPPAQPRHASTGARRGVFKSLPENASVISTVHQCCGIDGAHAQQRVAFTPVACATNVCT